MNQNKIILYLLESVMLCYAFISMRVIIFTHHSYHRAPSHTCKHILYGPQIVQQLLLCSLTVSSCGKALDELYRIPK